MNSKSVNLYIICLIVLILDGAHSLITSVYLSGFRSLLGLATMVSFMLIYNQKKRLSLFGLFFYLFLCIGVIINHRGDFIISLISGLPILSLFLLKRNDLLLIREIVNKFFVIVIAISLFIYICIFFINIYIPYEKIIYHQYEIKNYLFLYSHIPRYGFKFCGFCIEPGYMSLLCICLLAFNSFDLKKRSSIVYVLSVLFSLSLEGYILLLVGLIVSSICKNGRITNKMKRVLIVVGVILSFIVFFLNYKDGNNLVGEYIMERLVYDEEMVIVGNNRESLEAEMVIEPYFYSNQVWFGIGGKQIMRELDGADICSWRLFVVAYGAIYTIFLFFFTFVGILQTNKSKTIPFYILFLLDFYPHGGPFSEVMYFLVIIILLNLKHEQYQENNNQLALNTYVNDTNNIANKCFY